MLCVLKIVLLDIVINKYMEGVSISIVIIYFLEWICYSFWVCDIICGFVIVKKDYI